jgi:hypothetical protein
MKNYKKQGEIKGELEIDGNLKRLEKRAALKSGEIELIQKIIDTEHKIVDKYRHKNKIPQIFMWVGFAIQIIGAFTEISCMFWLGTGFFWTFFVISISNLFKIKKHLKKAKRWLDKGDIKIDELAVLREKIKEIQVNNN